MGNSSSAHGRLLKAVANDDDTFIKQIVLGTDEHERYKLLGAKAGWGSRGSKTALHLCAKEGKCRVLAALLLPLVTAVTAEIDAGSYPGRASHLLSRLVNKQQRAGRTPFLSACYYGQWQCAQQLLEAGSNVFAVDMDGNDALHLAAVSSRAEVVEQLLAIADHQAITSRLASIVNLSGFTPLHYAAWVGCAEAAQQLLAADVDQLQSSWGEYDRWLVVPLCSTALHVAALQLRPSVCIVLLQHYVLQLQDWLPGDPMPVDPRTRVNCQGQTPYHAALWKGLDPSSQLALLLNPTVDICSLFSLQQMNQHRKKGPLALRIIASTAVKHHLLQQLSVLEDQYQQQVQERELQLFQHYKQHSHHGQHAAQQQQQQQQHEVPSQQQVPGRHHHSSVLHHNKVASSNACCLAAAGVAAGKSVASPGVVVRNVASETVCSTSSAAAGPSECLLQCSSKRNLLQQANPGTFKQDPTGVPGANQHCSPGGDAAAGFMQQLQEQQRLGAKAMASRTSLCEIEACDESLAPAATAQVGSAEHTKQQHCSVGDSCMLKSKDDEPHSVLAPMLAPGSLAMRILNRPDIPQKGRLSHNSSFQRLSSSNGSRHSGTLSTLMAAEPSTVGEAGAANAAGHHAPFSVRGSGSWNPLTLRRTTSRSSSKSRRGDVLSSGAAAAEGAGSCDPRSPLNDVDISAVFGASTQNIAQILRDTGAADPSTLSYRHLTAHGRTVSMTVATSLAGALPGCVSESLSHSLQGNVLAGFSGAGGLVVSPGQKLNSNNPAVSTTGVHARLPSASYASAENAEAAAAAHEIQGPGTCSTPVGSSHMSVTCSAVHSSAVQHSLCGSLRANECGVCLDRLPAVLLAACDHTLCFECSKCIASESVGCRAPLCPFCRTVITGFGLMPQPAVHLGLASRRSDASNDLG